MTSTVKSRQSATATATATAAATAVTHGGCGCDAAARDGDAAAAARRPACPAGCDGAATHGDGSGETLCTVRRPEDASAWEELVGRYTGMLYAIARSYGLDPATSGDAVQTTWLRLVEHLGALREPSAVGGWLATTVRRQCLVLVRNRRRELPVEQAEELYPPDTDHSPENEVVARDRDAQVRAAFHRLPVKDRRLLACLMVSARSSYAARPPGLICLSAALGRPGRAASSDFAANWPPPALTTQCRLGDSAPRAAGRRNTPVVSECREFPAHVPISRREPAAGKTGSCGSVFDSDSSPRADPVRRAAIAARDDTLSFIKIRRRCEARSMS